MKGSILKVLFALFIAFTISGCSLKPMMIDERVSPYSVEETIEKIRLNATEIGWVVPGVKNMNRSVKKHSGKEIGAPVRIVELCNADHASAILSDENGRYSALLMPCAVAVYQKEDGQTYVSNMKAGTVGTMMGGVVAKVMGRVDQDQQKILRFLETSTQ
ncbi:MAG TPA: DUF302 domain-containing protein [Gammaproteobacteria bacterium]|nr:DUF302 domain-containing protein [Gammaproteobacteria bacterium]MBT3489768.1 DUF302 domain-containing protein [Gammaproteobacteria bacterium]MBT3719729.1 DUF302 domain-containing protein [Gammaproteobacteria bacterium]MBT4549425.1 DUF302 domain-containing protein [Gammaproteobacteria bacterium]MBT5687118.1 DUF302 domain-containing protein [Gammaproteobacteria bacterium]